MDVLRTCTHCDALAYTEDELDLFVKGVGNYKYGRRNLCKKCAYARKAEVYNPTDEQKQEITSSKRVSRINNKIKAVLHKGGKCSSCGIAFDGVNQSIFDFHHINPEDKTKRFRGLTDKAWQTIKQEISMCILVCSNCHRLIHNKGY